jgi:hypothetical protein
VFCVSKEIFFLVSLALLLVLVVEAVVAVVLALDLFAYSQMN